MQKYNTQRPPVKLPEYGRNVQELVNYCLTIPDRAKRTRYAYGVVSIMGDLYPNADQVENLQQILWDHLAILSDYKLDIDYPIEVTSQTTLEDRPLPLSNPQQGYIRWRVYGKVVEDMVQKACTLTDREQRLRLFELCANHMKLHFHNTHPNADEDDDKIIQDLDEYTGHRFSEEVYQVFLFSAKELKENLQYDPARLVEAARKKKKKKKKKSGANANT